MIIHFVKIDETVMHRFKNRDGETLIRGFYDGTNKMMRGRLLPGCTIANHTHETSSETIFIHPREALCQCHREEERHAARQSHCCPKGHSHSLANASATLPHVYLAVVPEQ